MTEDARPLYDIESYWEMDDTMTRARVQAYKHKEYPSCYRLVDFANQDISFNDISRVHKVIDIHSKLDEREVRELMPKILSVINAERPITMPYKPEKLTVYICKFDGVLGILYYKVDTEEEKNVYPVRRYYKMDYDPVLTFIEMNGDEYIRKYNKKFID